MLPSFEVVNFRTFRDLRIERFARVNLIVGKNGVGKTTLLQSLRFYGGGGLIALRECLADHDEWQSLGVAGEAILDVRALFHRRDGKPPEAHIGLLGDETSCFRIRLVDVERVEESDGGYYYEEAKEEALVGTGAEILEGAVVLHEDRRLLIPPQVSRRGQVRGKYVGPAFVSARGVGEPDLTYWWETIALTPSQDRVLESLSMLDTITITGITTVANPSTGGRMFKVRLKGERAPVPLGSLGGGLDRIFQLAVALEYSHLARESRQPSFFGDADDNVDGEPSRMLLVDEIENGIHYTIYPDLWRAVFRLAREHNIQVFATTHSWDCVKGFQQAAAQDQQSDALLIRLESGRGKSRAFVFSEEDLAVVTREQIEVR